jgi:hypothetical protein
VLASSGSGTAVRSGHKGACLPACNAHPTRVGGGVTEGRPRANNMASNRHAPGPQRWKASRSLRARSPSREGTRARVSADSGRARGVSSPAQHHRVGDHGVLEQLRRRGASSHLVMRRRMRGEGRSFTPGCLARAAHSRRINPSPAQPVAGSQRRPQAALRRAMTFSVPTCRRACSAGRRMLSELTQLAARSSRKGWAVARRALRKEQHGSGGKHGGRLTPKGLDVQGGRGSDARKGCARASLVCCRSR